jgi:hypothetical protein
MAYSSLGVGGTGDAPAGEACDITGVKKTPASATSAIEAIPDVLLKFMTYLLCRLVLSKWTSYAFPHPALGGL